VRNFHPSPGSLAKGEQTVRRVESKEVQLLKNCSYSKLGEGQRGSLFSYCKQHLVELPASIAGIVMSEITFLF